MKTSSIVILIIGILLLILQYMGYKGNNFQFPPLHKGFDAAALGKNTGTILGYNLIGLLGLVLIIIALTRKAKKK
jgi:hypothetical protein